VSATIAEVWAIAEVSGAVAALATVVVWAVAIAAAPDRTASVTAALEIREQVRGAHWAEAIRAPELRRAVIVDFPVRARVAEAMAAALGRVAVVLARVAVAPAAAEVAVVVDGK
jgi:hypothetical protein